MTEITAPRTLVPVRLVGFPLDIYQRSAQHNQELMREFALLMLHQPEGGGHVVPQRLLAIMAELTERYAGTTEEVNAERDAAIERGEQVIDLRYHVPPEARDACLHLGIVLDEADEYCRRGDHLLTLATPPDAKAFRDWYLGEFVAQIDGQSPTPWPEYAATVSTA